MKYHLLFAALVMLTVTACGTAVPVTDQTPIDQTPSEGSLEATRVRPPPPPKPVSLAFRTYTVTVVRNGLTLRGFFNITNEAVPNQRRQLERNPTGNHGSTGWKRSQKAGFGNRVRGPQRTGLIWHGLIGDVEKSTQR